MSNLKTVGQRALTYTVVVATILWAAGLGALVPSANAATLVAGDLIKGSSSSVYYYAADGKRHAFTNEKAFKTWFSDFSKVKTITDAEMQTYTLGANVLYRAGTRLVKINTDPKVYAVEPSGALRAIASEQVAKDLYGDNWNKIIDDVADVFFPNYSTGSALASAMPPVGTLMKKAGSSDLYYVDTTGVRMFSDLNAFNANGFMSVNVRTVSDAVFGTVAMATTNATISGMELALATYLPAASFPTTPTTPTSGTGLTVALASDTPAGSTMIADATNGGQAQAAIAKFNFTAAADGDVTVTTLKLKRDGVANDSDINNAYLYDGTTRLAEVQSISGGLFTFAMPSGLFTVAKGTTRGVWVKVDVAPGATSGKTIGVSINAATDVMTTNTATTVSGTFPMKGNLHGIAVVTDLGKLTVTSIAGSTTVDALKDSELWKFNLQASNQNLKVTRLSFTNVGSTSATDLVNFRLMDGSTQVGSTVAAMDASKVVSFDLSAAPLMITSGVTKQLTLRGDIIAGANRTFQFSFQKPSDVQSWDVQYNVPLFPFPAGGTVGLWNVVQPAITTVNAGTITVSKGADSPTTDIVVGGTNVTIASWDLKANGEDVKVSTATFTPTITSNRTIKNVKLVYEGTQVGTTTTTVTGGTNFAYTPGNSLIIRADGMNHKLAIIGDTTGTAVANDTVLITFAVGASNGQGMNSLTAVNVPGSATATNTVNLKGGTLTPSRTGVTTATFVKNTSSVALGEWSIAAGSAENVDISSLTVKDSNAAGTANGTVGIGSAFNNLELWNVSGATPVKIAQTISNPSATAGTSNVFNISPSVLVSSTTPVTVRLTGSVLSSAVWTTAGDAIGITAISGTGKVTSSTVSYSATAPASTIGSSITVADTGSLSISVDTSGAVASQFYTAGLADQEFAKLRLTSTNEDIKLSKLVLKTINGTSNITSLKLMGTGLASDPTATVDSSGLATFNFATNDQLMVTKDTSKSITVKGTLGTIGAIVPGNFGVASFGEADATGASSGTVVQENFGGTAGTNYYVAGTNAYSGDLGDVIYFTKTGDAGTNTAAGFYMVTTDDDAVNLATGDLDLNGEATDTSWTAGDVVTKLTKVEAIAGNANAGVAYAVGDIVYVYDADDNEARFAVVTTAVASGAAISGLGFSPAGSIAIAAAGDRVTKLSNVNALAGNTMQYEEVEAWATMAASGNPSGTVSPNSEQVIAVYDVKASGLRDMTLSAFTVEKQGSNTPEQYVTKMSLWNGATKLAEVANSTVAGTFDDEANDGLAITAGPLNICTGATTGNVKEIGGITTLESPSLQVGDKITFVTSGGADVDTSTATITGIAGTLDACDGNAATGRVLTLDSAVTIDADDTGVTFRNFRIHFDADQANTGDTALSAQTITQNTTLSLTVKADTSLVRTGITSGTVTFGVTIPGTTGPLATTTNGLTWTYTKFATTGTAHTGTTADGYPINGNTLTY